MALPDTLTLEQAMRLAATSNQQTFNPFSENLSFEQMVEDAKHKMQIEGTCIDVTGENT